MDNGKKLQRRPCMSCSVLGGGWGAHSELAAFSGGVCPVSWAGVLHSQPWPLPGPEELI